MGTKTIYEFTDIPPGMTCDEYRRMRYADSVQAGRGLGFLRRLLKLATR
jgi:hypothetical protein